MARSQAATTVRERLLAVVGPVAVTVTAYGLWWISDRLLYVGPLDRAAFGWLVVIPVLLAAPIVAGVTWRRLSDGRDVGAALVVGSVVGLGSALLLWQAVASTACETASIRSATDSVLPSLLVGSLVGTALVAGGLWAARLIRGGRRLAAAVAAVSLDVVLLAAALAAFAVLFAGPACQRPIPAG